MAVGAQRSEVVAMIVREGVSVVSVGLFFGMAGSIFLKRVLATMIYNFANSTVDVLVSAGILMLAVAALTSLLAAFRAASIQPEVALRNE
jgi:ABC-type antimicrobial peptide transport system permease subunit